MPPTMRDVSHLVMAWASLQTHSIATKSPVELPCVLPGHSLASFCLHPGLLPCTPVAQKDLAPSLRPWHF